MTTSFLDTDIQREVRRLLKWDSRVDATAIEVTVREGRVRLTGTVLDRQSSLTAVTIAAGVNGVFGVKSFLEQELGFH